MRPNRIPTYSCRYVPSAIWLTSVSIALKGAKRFLSRLKSGLSALIWMKTTIQSAENLEDTNVYLESRINQLEETIPELYQAFCQEYGNIEFDQMAPQSFVPPYTIHTIHIPRTKLEVTFVTTPPHLIIGTPPHTPGPLQWEHILEIQLPRGTKFVSFRYGGGIGELEWFDA